MSRTIQLPDVRGILTGLDKRLGVLERRTTTPQEIPGSSLTFSYAGTLTTTVSPPARVRGGGMLTDLAVTLGTAGSSDTLLVVGKNGLDAATLTVPAGEVTYDGTVGVRYGPDDLLVVVIASPGTGAADMTAEARFA